MEQITKDQLQNRLLDIENELAALEATLEEAIQSEGNLRLDFEEPYNKALLTSDKSSEKMRIADAETQNWKLYQAYQKAEIYVEMLKVRQKLLETRLSALQTIGGLMKAEMTRLG